MTTEKKGKRIAMRMDFIQEIESSEELEDGSMVYRASFTPDPKRYDYIEDGKKSGYKDKNTGYFIPIEVFKEMVSQMGGAPIFYKPAKERDFCNYLKERRRELSEHWDDKYLIQKSYKPIDEFLEILRGKETQLVILYVDLEGSTKISTMVDSETNMKIVKIFLMQMAKVVDNFNGFVFKFIGDCVIGIFPADTNFTSMCDNAIQAAMIMSSVVEDVINPIFKEKDLPPIGCHIGLDIGSVRVDDFGVNDIATVTDLIGAPMNLTAKIQSKAGHNEILLGRRMFELIHCNWQLQCEKIESSEEWDLKDPDRGTPYEVYKFIGKYQCNCE